MNTTKKTSIVRIEVEALSALMTEVKETVARDVIVPGSLKGKKFAAVNLWKCRKASRTNGLSIR